jgi:hypothetical protein
MRFKYHLSFTLIALIFVFTQLNGDDSIALISAIANTAFSISLTILFVFIIGISLTILNEYSPYIRKAVMLIQLIPQIVWLIIAYSFLNEIIVQYAIGYMGIISSSAIMFSFVLLPNVFLFLEERLNYEKEHGAYYPLRTLGVSLLRSILSEVLWRQNRVHLFLKMCALVASLFFLQISIEFIISVGLSETIGVINFPLSLGQLLVQIGSKQDLLAVAYSLFNPSYLSTLFSQHLFGLSIAFCIFTGMITSYKISSIASEILDD